MEEIKYKGIWWLPSEKEYQIQGVLSYTKEEGTYLQLDGFLGESDTYDLIHGFSNIGEKITLQDAFIVTKQKRYGTGLDECKIFANKLFIGAWLENKTKFNKLLFRTNLLDEWVDKSGFDIDFVDFYRQNKPGKISYKLPDPIELYSSDKINIKIIITAKTPALSLVQTEAIIQQRAFFEVNFVEKNDFNSLYNILYQLRNFISLGTLKPVIPIEVYCYSNEHLEAIGKTEYPSKISIYLRWIGNFRDYDVIPQNMLFTLQDILPSSTEKLNWWLVKHEELSPVFDLFFSIIYSPPSYQETEFLSLIQAVEAYHRRTHKNFDLNEDQHEERVSSIINAIPVQYKKWLKYRLRYSNEPTLMSRLKELFDEFNGILSNFIKREEFVNLSVITRNYLIHFDKPLENSRASGPKFTFLIELYNCLLLLCLLTATGFSQQEIKKMSQKFDIHRLKIFKFT